MFGCTLQGGGPRIGVKVKPSGPWILSEPRHLPFGKLSCFGGQLSHGVFQWHGAVQMLKQLFVPGKEAALGLLPANPEPSSVLPLRQCAP
jgi:hypothetical protein